MLSITEQLLCLRRVVIFRDMTFEALRPLVRYLETRYFPAGDIIYHEGDNSRNLYILASGRVDVVRDYGKPTERQLACLEAGEFFGEMGIFEDKPHAATLVVREDACVFVLAADTFKRLIVEHPSIAFAMGRELSARVRRSTASDTDR